MLTEMSDVLSAAYPWTKALHVISVVAWMAGLFYLPRLFVYHTEVVVPGSDTDRLFQTMERRLLKGIMNPAMVASWTFGVLLALTPGVVDWGAAWPWTKLVGILGMTGFHEWLAARRRGFVAGTNRVSGRTYRIMNELPTVLLIVIVLSVIVKF